MDTHKRPLSRRVELLERFIEMNGINKMCVRGLLGKKLSQWRCDLIRSQGAFSLLPEEACYINWHLL